MTRALPGFDRRRFLAVAAALPFSPAATQPELVIPVRHVLDGRRKWSERRLNWYWSRLWPQAAADLHKCGIVLESTQDYGEVWRPPDRSPEIEGVRRGVLNVVLTHTIPMHWDQSRGLAGLALLYRGCHVCMIALERAHLHEIPFLSVNSCVHEVLHALLMDIFEVRPAGLAGELRELRVDWLATRLWLFGDGGPIRRAAQVYVDRLRPVPA